MLTNPAVCRLAIAALLGAGVASCSRRPVTSVSAEPLPVAAPVTRTWDAMVETLVAQQIPTQTVSRESGLLETSQVSISGWSMTTRKAVARDCGFGKSPAAAQLAILVRGDSARSSVKVSARFAGMNSYNGDAGACASTGSWEAQLEQQIKARAEGGK